MSGVVDVGEALELTFNGSPDSLVTVSWLDPGQVAVIDGQTVPESSSGSGSYPQVLTPTVAGMWTALFTGPGQPETYYVRARSVTGPRPLAAVGDIVDQFGTMTAAQEGLAGHLCRSASALLRQQIRQTGGDLDADIAAGRVDPEVAALTVTNMVLRVMRNPRGLRAETTGPFSRTYDTTAAAGLLVVTDYDLQSVSPVDVIADGGPAALGVGTIRVVPGLAPDRWPSRHSGRSYGGWPYGR